ncbi:MAG: glycosyltransferase [Acidobacteriota bacterium]
MRIGVLTDVLVEDPWSGIGNYIRCLVREWSQEHEVWSFGSARRAPEGGFSGHVQVSRWRWGWRRRLESRADIVHAPRPHVPDYFYEIERPKVVTIHGAGPFALRDTSLVRPPTELQRHLREQHEKIDLFITVSQSSRQELIEHYGIAKEKIEAIYHGVDPAVYFPPADRQALRQRVAARYNIPGPYLLHVSNYRPVKNGVRIVQAYRRLVRQGRSELSLVFAGGAYFGFEEVAEEIRKGADGRIVCLGKLPEDELREVYQGAEVFVFPSLHEGFGFPALESMACEVPVIVSNVFSLPEVVGEAGVQVDPESVEAIAKGIVRLLDDRSLYERCRQAGLARSREFCWETCARKHLEVLERLRWQVEPKPSQIGAGSGGWPRRAPAKKGTIRLHLLGPGSPPRQVLKKILPASWRNALRPLVDGTDFHASPRSWFSRYRADRARLREWVAYEAGFHFWRATRGRSARLEHPIFMVGCSRSGTTLAANLFGLHRDVVHWSEAHDILDPENYRDYDADHYRTASDVTSKEAARLHARFEYHRRVHGRRRFLNKNPRNSVRIDYLRAIFADAVFVHVIRDGRAVVASMLEFIRARPALARVPMPFEHVPNWRTMLVEDLAERMALEWQAVVSMILGKREELKRAYHEFKYEDLCEEPRAVMTEVWRFAGLRVDEEILTRVPERLELRNHKWRSQLTAEQIERITRIQSRLLRELGYEV